MSAIQIQAQPDDVTCGPSCLASLYDYYADHCDLSTLITEIPMLPTGGTLAVFLANHALRRGYQATIYTYNLAVFDPSWFAEPGIDLATQLRLQASAKQRPEVDIATRGYLEFLELGGELRMQDLTPQLIRQFLDQKTPILTGLSATWLYRSPREIPASSSDDPIRGEPAGHFVILSAICKAGCEVQVADPYADNPMAEAHIYSVDFNRLLNAILLGVLTYDANMLIIRPA